MYSETLQANSLEEDSVSAWGFGEHLTKCTANPWLVSGGKLEKTGWTY